MLLQNVSQQFYGVSGNSCHFITENELNIHLSFGALMFCNELYFCIFWNKLYFVMHVFIILLEGILGRPYRINGGVEWTRMFLEDICIVSD